MSLFAQKKEEPTNAQNRAYHYKHCPDACSDCDACCVRRFGLNVTSVIVSDDHSADDHRAGRAHGYFDGQSDQRCQRKLFCAELELGKCNLMYGIGQLERLPTNERQRIDRRTQRELQLHTDLYRIRRVGCRNGDDYCDGRCPAAASSTDGEFNGDSRGRYERGYFRAQLELN